MNYYVTVNDAQTGPYTLDELKSRIAAGTFTGDEKTWQNGSSEWLHLKDVILPPKTAPSDSADSLKVFISRDGQKYGPFSIDEIDKYLVEGNVLLTDWAFYRGLEGWIPLSSIPGVLPPPPTILPPSTITPASTMIANTKTTAPTERITVAEYRICIWDPYVAALGGVLFSTAFGAFIHARNAETLGRSGEAKANWKWFYAYLFFIGIVSLSILTPSLNMTGIFNIVSFVMLLVWYFTLGKNQTKYVKDTFGGSYQKKSWDKPLLIAFALVGLVLLAGALL